ncbi:hypothetical protein B0H14DRAFT_1286164 [Mycena olivaceomarginata]|nr:hypothetical protein B0H14DRAFT_1286164 [Mycena olivaceomarginata]
MPSGQIIVVNFLQLLTLLSPPSLIVAQTFYAMFGILFRRGRPKYIPSAIVVWIGPETAPSTTVVLTNCSRISSSVDIAQRSRQLESQTAITPYKSIRVGGEPRSALCVRCFFPSITFPSS